MLMTFDFKFFISQGVMTVIWTVHIPPQFVTKTPTYVAAPLMLTVMLLTTVTLIATSVWLHVLRIMNVMVGMLFAMRLMITATIVESVMVMDVVQVKHNLNFKSFIEKIEQNNLLSVIHWKNIFFLLRIIHIRLWQWQQLPLPNTYLSGWP